MQLHHDDTVRPKVSSDKPAPDSRKPTTSSGHVSVSRMSEMNSVAEMCPWTAYSTRARFRSRPSAKS